LGRGIAEPSITAALEGGAAGPGSNLLTGKVRYSLYRGWVGPRTVLDVAENLAHTGIYKYNPEQATMAQKESRGIDLLFL